MMTYANKALAAAGLLPNYARAAAAGQEREAQRQAAPPPPRAIGAAGRTAASEPVRPIPAPSAAVPSAHSLLGRQLPALLLQQDMSPNTQAAARRGLTLAHFCANCWSRETARAGRLPSCDRLGHDCKGVGAVSAVLWSKDTDQPFWVAVRPPPVESVALKWTI